MPTEVGSHHVHGVGKVLPGARHARHLGLTAQLTFGADLNMMIGNLRLTTERNTDSRS
jgi:hypothetical protein